MCNVVKADELLAVFLEKKNQISFRQIRKYRNIIEDTNPNLILDISAPSINWAIDCYPNIFMRNRTHVMRAGGSLPYFNSQYLDNEFFSNIQHHVLNQLKGAISQI